MVARRQQLCVVKKTGMLSETITLFFGHGCFQISNRAVYHAVNRAYRVRVHMNRAGDHPFKRTQARFVKHVRAHNTCVHTNQMN